MSKPKEEAKSDRYFKDVHFLYEILTVLKDTEELKFFLKEILTKSELLMIKRRWHILNLVSMGYDLRTTANMSNSSTQTVVKLKKLLVEGKGIRKVLEKINELEMKNKKEFIKTRKRGGSKFVKGWFD